VLAGGEARRLGGVDKALLDIGGATMLDRVLGALWPHCHQLVVVGPPRKIAVKEVRYTLEAEPGGGPVPAVAAGLAEAEGADVAVLLAVDFPLLRARDIGTLLAALDRDGVDAVTAVDHRGRPNPLLAAYRCEWLRSAVAGLGPGTAAGRLLPESPVMVDLSENATLNVNDADDLARARRLVR